MQWQNALKLTNNQAVILDSQFLISSQRGGLRVDIFAQEVNGAICKYELSSSLVKTSESVVVITGAGACSCIRTREINWTRCVDIPLLAVFAKI